MKLNPTEKRTDRLFCPFLNAACMRHPCPYWSGDENDCLIRMAAFGIVKRLKETEIPTMGEVPEDPYSTLYDDEYDDYLDKLVKSGPSP